jgi:hypothetical protein
MAFDYNKMNRIALNGDTAIYLYTTSDALNVVEAADYFVDYYTTFDVNDIIMVQTASGNIKWL